jgi:hypothetical protein
MVALTPSSFLIATGNTSTRFLSLDDSYRITVSKTVQPDNLLHTIRVMALRTQYAIKNPELFENTLFLRYDIMRKDTQEQFYITIYLERDWPEYEEFITRYHAEVEKAFRNLIVKRALEVSNLTAPPYPPDYTHPNELMRILNTLQEAKGE